MMHNCPHCGKPINPAAMMGSVKSPKKEAAAKANGERLRKMYANARKLGGLVVDTPAGKSTVRPDGSVNVVLAQPEDEISVAPRPTTLEGKKAAAMAAMASATSGSGWAKQAAQEIIPELSNVPKAPFDVNLGGEPHRVTIFGKNLALFYIGGGAPAYVRQLAPGELETFWAARIK